jgi:hypothetical protein
MAEHGDAKLTDLLVTLAPCEKARSVSVHDGCKAVYEGLWAPWPSCARERDHNPIDHRWRRPRSPPRSPSCDQGAQPRDAGHIVILALVSQLG